jgi:phospholipase C
MRWVAIALSLLAACGDNQRPDCGDAPATCRASCAYGAGDRPSLTLRDQPIGSAIPIDHVVLVMQENRTFDHYFSTLTIPGQDIDVAPPDVTNPDPQHPGQTIRRFHQTQYCFDNPGESWDEVHREIDGGALDAFTTVNAENDPQNDPSGTRAMGYYDETDIPYYYALARAWALSDRHFSSVQANTWPNRMFYMAATAYGIITDEFAPMSTQVDANGNLTPNLFTRMNDAHVTWKFYAQDLPTLAILYATLQRSSAHIAPYAQFATDAAAGTLPQVSFVEGTALDGGVTADEDPPADMQFGQQMVSQIVSAVTSSPLWPHSAVFFSYDEQGGFYDHVPPQPACIPDDIPPTLGPGDVDAAFDETGLRVPLIVISPYAKRGYVSHVVTEHTSITRFIEARFGLPALTHRDANAVPPFDMFDFGHPDLSVPAMPDAVIDQVKGSACMAQFPHQ